MITEKREKQILLTSFVSGLMFAISEFVFAIYSRSQSALTDAVYDVSELVFIALLLFITPLFHKPVSEKRPYGYFQIESIFVIIRSVMMLSVTFGISAEIIQSALSGGNTVNNSQVSFFQMGLALVSTIIFLVIKKLNKNVSSPTIQAELLGWKLDIAYSIGISLAFFVAMLLKNTPLGFITPYFDQIIAVFVMIFMLPESVKILWGCIKELFLFSPQDDLVNDIKALSNPILDKYSFLPVFYNVTKTGRHLWIAIYFNVESENMSIEHLQKAINEVSGKIKEYYSDSTCELILVPQNSPQAV